jgi:molybdenum cofactor biosynthesis protein B
MGAAAHREAAGHGPVTIGLVTVSDSRTPETDDNGHYLHEQFTTLGHVIGDYAIVRDEPDQVASVLERMVALPGMQIVIFNGGTGISPRDTTYDVIAAKLEKTLPGFGELFRMLSFEQIGAAAMLSRATAGVYRGKFIISIPGSPKAVRLAMGRLILPELNHLAWEVVRK